MFDSDLDPISPALHALLTLFSEELSDVKFPGLDGEVLEHAAGEVKERAVELARAQAALDDARRALQESQELLLQRGQRALSYARVYAEDDAVLTGRLDAINLPRPLRRTARAEGSEAAGSTADDSAPRRRGRPPRVRTPDSLFTEGAAEPAPAS